MEIPEWFQRAEKELGTKEISGDASNPQIEKYWEAVRGSPAYTDDVPWCAAFVNWCLRGAGVLGTGKPNARSFLNWGANVDEPRCGDVVVFYRGKKDGWQGHVAFFHSWSLIPGFVNVMGGNQNDQVSIARYHVRRVLDYRRP